MIISYYWETIGKRLPRLFRPLQLCANLSVEREWMPWDGGGDTEHSSFSGSHITLVPTAPASYGAEMSSRPALIY